MSGAKVVTPDMVIDAFVRTRDTIEKIKKEAEEKVSQLQDLQSKREAWLLAEMDKLHLTSLPSEFGTAYHLRKESVTMGDWDAFWNYVCETEQYNLLQHVVSKPAALEIMGAERQNPPPPGVNYVAIRRIGVRRKS